MRYLLFGAFFAILYTTYGEDPGYVRKSPYNITGKWYLPNPTSPLFYLQFRDKISWVEADAVCQFHHAELVTVDNQKQFDELKTYLKELNFEEPIWIGLRRADPNGPFKWTDEGTLEIDEYWLETPPPSEKLCVTSFPAENFGWRARQCNGPEAAAFVCELLIPEWVRKSGCLTNKDPNVVITFNPEKSTIHAGLKCPLTNDSLYTECHDPEDDKRKIEENAKNMKVKMDCPIVTAPAATAPKLNCTKNYMNLTEFMDKVYNAKIEYTIPNGTETTANGVLEVNTSAGAEILYDATLLENINSIYNVTMQDPINTETTIQLPKEMSVAEEPIKDTKILETPLPVYETSLLFTQIPSKVTTEKEPEHDLNIIKKPKIQDPKTDKTQKKQELNDVAPKSKDLNIEKILATENSQKSQPINIKKSLPQELSTVKAMDLQELSSDKPPTAKDLNVENGTVKTNEELTTTLSIKVDQNTEMHQVTLNMKDELASQSTMKTDQVPLNLKDESTYQSTLKTDDYLSSTSTTAEATETSEMTPKFNSADANMIPTSNPEKAKLGKGAQTEIMVEVETKLPAESHEMFNDDSQSPHPSLVKKSMDTENYEFTKNVDNKSSESKEIEEVADRTYNIEGTFDSNYLTNSDNNTQVYKKIDLSPMGATETIIAQTQLKIVDGTNSTVATNATLEIENIAAGTNATTPKKEDAIPRTTETKITSTSEETTLRSPLLSGADEDPQTRGRKRHILNSERHSFYPYFLGRIMG